MKDQLELDKENGYFMKETETNREREKGRRGKKKKSLWFLNLLIVILIAVMVFCAYQIISQLLEDKKGKDVYGDVASEAVMEETETAIVESGGVEETVTLRKINFQTLWGINKDVIGWLECENTIVNYPVVQGKDNEYYLKHLLDGTYHRFGTLFADCANAADFTDQNTVIYGHHIKAGTMFQMLDNYKEPDYYQEHPYFMLYLPDRTYRIELFAGCLVDGADGVPLNFSDAQEYQDYIDSLRAKSTFTSPVEMTAEDRMVTLYTCAYDFETARYVVCGKLVEVTS